MNGKDTLRLLRFAIAIVAIWVAFAFFNSSEFYRRTIESNAGPQWDAYNEVLSYQMSFSLLWAVFTPFVLFIAERLPLHKSHRLRNALLLIAIVPPFVLVRSAFGGAVFQLVERRLITTDFIMTSIRATFHRNVFTFAGIVLLTNLLLALRAAAARDGKAIAMRTAMARTELQRLRSSMQPRLMFATLDAIAAKVQDQPDVADRMLVELGDLLRALLEFGKRSAVTLAEELEVIDRYFEFEKMRTERTFTTRVDVEEEVLDARVPPLLLHALVESALLSDRESPRRLEIRGRSDGGMLSLEVRYDDPSRVPAAAAIDEARARLLQAYGAGASVSWRRTADSVVTELSVPYQMLEASA